jgi:hypothetical protein
MSEAIPSEYRGWWRITETSQWVNDGLDILGPALLSITGHGHGAKVGDVAEARAAPVARVEREPAAAGHKRSRQIPHQGRELMAGCGL